MTKWSGGRLNTLAVEVVCGVSSRLCDLHLRQSSPAFPLSPAGGILRRYDRTRDCQRHLGRYADTKTTRC